MKALSIRHPYVTAILAGRRSVEARAYPTRHRGDLLLHAAAAYGWREKEEQERLRRLGVDLPVPEAAQRGALLGMAQLTECRPMVDEDWSRALLEPREGEWWAWELAAVEAFPEPIPYRGHIFMWEVPDSDFDAALATAST